MNNRQDRKADIAARAGAQSPRRCTVLGCGRQAHGLITASTRKFALCKKHHQQRRRTGSANRKSLTLAERKPYERATRRVLKPIRERPDVQRAVTAMERMLAAAGQPETVWRVRGLKSDQRVRVILARARESGATGWWLLEKGLAIRACLAAKHIDWREREYIFANLAKPVHRGGAGLKVTRADELLPPKYPRCEGRLQSHLGKMLDAALSAVSDQLVPQIVAMAASELTRKHGTEAERRASTGNPKARHISVRSPLSVSPGGPLVREGPKVVQVTGSEPTEGGGEDEERTPSNQGAHRATPKGNGDGEIVPSHPHSPVLFFDPWLTSWSPTMLAITAEALMLLSEPAPE